MHRHLTRRTTLLAMAALASPLVWAHDFRAGDLRVDHPHALPSRPGLRTGGVYLRTIRNGANQSDRLVAARTPVAERVEIHHMRLDGDVMRMRAVSALEIPARGQVALRHGSADGHHLMLHGLKAPLADGQRFPVTLVFERAGELEVVVWVQSPRRPGEAADAGHDAH